MGEAELRAVYRLGRRYSTSVATIHILPRNSAGLRVAVPVAKRIGSAVVRNRVRRRLREALRRFEHGLLTGADLVIVGRREASEAPFDAILNGVRGALTYARLIDHNLPLEWQ